MRIKDLPKTFRPREKLKQKGVENLTLIELIAIIISTGSKGQNVLELSTKIATHIEAGQQHSKLLTTFKGLGPIKSQKLLAAIELGKRIYDTNLTNKILINSSKEAYLALYEYAHKPQEHLLLLALNARNELLAKEVVTVGTLDTNLFHPREIFHLAIQHNSSRILIAHNHPSGSLTPSQEDIEMTKRIHQAGLLLDIPLVDSLVLSKEGYISLINQI